MHADNTGRPARHTNGLTGSEAAVLAVFAAGIGGVALVWAAANLAGLLTRGHWPGVGFAVTTRAVLALVRHRTGWTAAWPAGDRGRLAGPGPSLTVAGTLAVLLAVLGVTVARRWSRAARRPPGFATTGEIRRQLSARAVVRRTAQLRPSLAGARRVTATDVGYHLGRDPASRLGVYSTVEDSHLVVGPPRSGKGRHLVIPITRAAPGAAVVASTKPDTLHATVADRQHRGPVLVFDPHQQTDTATRLRWAPERGCHDPLVAISRARSLTLAAGQQRGVDGGEFWAGMTQAVVRCYLHAAALDHRTARDILRWTTNPTDPDPLRILRTASGAADGWDEELAEQTSADPRQRGSVWAGVRRAFDALADPRVLHACTPQPTDAFKPAEFLQDNGTLYLLGTSGAQLSVAPLITALVEDITETARRLAAISPAGRLDPPLTLVLDEAANIAPLPTLPSLVADGGGVGITTIVVLQTLAQLRARWGPDAGEAVWDASTIKLILGGLTNPRDLQALTTLTAPDPATATSRRNTMTTQQLRSLPTGHAIALHRTTQPVLLHLPT